MQAVQSVLSRLSQPFSGIPPLLFRLILAPVMIIAGYNKLQLGNGELAWYQRLLADPNVAGWFGNTEWGLGLPMPDLLALLAGWTEFVGGFLLLIGLLTRLVSVPLIVTMVVAMLTVHAPHGWFAIAPSSGQTSPAAVLNWFGIAQAQTSLQQSTEVAERLDRIKGILEEHGNTDYLYQYGPVAILNNGVEFGFIYFTMLLSLLFTGGGRWVSVDYYLGLWRGRKLRDQL